MLVLRLNASGLFIKNELFCYLDSSTGNLGILLFWFDQELNLYRESDNKLIVISGSRKLILKVFFISII